MARRREKPNGRENGHPVEGQGATTGYEAELWKMADTLRGSMDAAEYKHVVLGLLFLKYISDAFEERRAEILREQGEDAAEDRDEYLAEHIFWAPEEARWRQIREAAKQTAIGERVDAAMAAVERENSDLRDVLPKIYARPGLDPARLGQLIDRISGIGGRAALNQHLFKVTSTHYPRWFYYHHLVDRLPWFQRIASAKVTTMGHIRRRHIEEEMCAVPDDRLLEAAGGVMEVLVRGQIENSVSTRKLALLRDRMATKLLSGELRARG